MTPTRRDFIKFVVTGAVTAGCPFNFELLAQNAKKPATVDGEEHAICHQVRDLFAFDLPRVTAARDLVIIGGGMSGLTAAYLSPNPWKYTSIAAVILCIWLRPATTPRSYRWQGVRSIASFSPTPIP